MIKIASRTDLKTGILFFSKEAAAKLYDGEGGIFRGEYLHTFPRIASGGEQAYLIGIGDKELTKRNMAEIAACGSAFMRENRVCQFYVDLTGLKGILTNENFSSFIQGLCLGGYEQPAFGGEGNRRKEASEITLIGSGEIPGLDADKVSEGLIEGIHLSEGILFARDMVNYPGNLLRPSDFAEAIRMKMEGLDVEVDILHKKELEKLEMGGLLTVGEGSAFEPCMAVLRYRGGGQNNSAGSDGSCERKVDITKENGHLGLIGKGVTCDTGGYCLKPSGSMAGIRGDMAGGAAVAGCIYALAKNRVDTSVTGIIPICENRISPGSYLPGDVITMYDKTTVEICNTDAEGRLILADAAAYAVECEGVDKVVDIATLTGAVVNLFGFTIGGVLCNDDIFFREFSKASEKSGEQYARIPYYEEHEEMLKSTMADIKNLGPDYCGTITAGLFIHRFVKGKPWLHMDIAGTAWVDTPVWKFQSKGATGAGVTTLYELAHCGNET